MDTDETIRCVRCGRPARQCLDEVVLYDGGFRVFTGPLCRACLDGLRAWLKPKAARHAVELVIPIRVEIPDRERAKLAAVKTLLGG